MLISISKGITIITGYVKIVLLHALKSLDLDVKSKKLGIRRVNRNDHATTGNDKSSQPSILFR